MLYVFHTKLSPNWQSQIVLFKYRLGYFQRLSHADQKTNINLFVEAGLKLLRLIKPGTTQVIQQCKRSIHLRGLSYIRLQSGSLAEEILMSHRCSFQIKLIPIIVDFTSNYIPLCTDSLKLAHKREKRPCAFFFIVLRVIGHISVHIKNVH